MNTQNEIFFAGDTGVAGSLGIDELIQKNYSLRIMIRNVFNNNKKNFCSLVPGDLSQPANLQKISRANAGSIHYAFAS